MKNPWFPFWIGDYTAKTMHLTTIQHGAYLLLMIHYYAHGSLPTQPEELMAIAKMSPEEWRGNCLAIARFFTPDWRHERVEEELFRRKTISQKRAYAGLKGAWVKHGGPVNKEWQMPTHNHSHILERKNGR